MSTPTKLPKSEAFIRINLTPGLSESDLSEISRIANGGDTDAVLVNLIQEGISSMRRKSRRKPHAA